MPKIKLELSFYADCFDLNEITKSFAIQPTISWTKGEELPSLKNVAWTRIDRPKPTRKETCWIYEIGYIETYDINELSESLLDVFEPQIDIIKKVIKENNLNTMLSVVAMWNTEESAPALGANKRLIKFLSEIGGYINEDLYII